MCDRSNAEDIVQEMLTYLETADYTIREEMVKRSFASLRMIRIALLVQVLKIAILSEKYAVDYKWYLDVMLKLIRIAGDFVSEEVNRWSRRTNSDDQVESIRFGIESFKWWSIEPMCRVTLQRSLSKLYKRLLAMRIWSKSPDTFSVNMEI